MDDIVLRRVNGRDSEFIDLVSELDAELAIIDGEDHEFYHQFNTIHDIDYAVTAYFNNTAVGCGAIKEFDSSTVEVKRMFVLPEYRGKGISSIILAHLEGWALELNYRRSILETGKRQIVAVNLYKKRGYRVVLNYGQYAGVENSVCFEKFL